MSTSDPSSRSCSSSPTGWRGGRSKALSTAYGFDLAVVLPAREREVLDLVLHGHSTRSAGGVLGLAESTVKSHAAKAAARLGMKSSRQAAAEASRRGLIAHGMIDLREDAAAQDTPGSRRRG